LLSIGFQKKIESGVTGVTSGQRGVRHHTGHNLPNVIRVTTVGMTQMDFSDEDIRRSVRKWLRIAENGGDLPVVLMPCDPEGRDGHDGNYAAFLHADRPAG